MLIETVHDTLKGLDTPQKTRLHYYKSNLASDKKKRHRDNNVRKVLDKYSLDVAKNDNLYEYLEGIGFSQAIYEYEQLHEQLLRFTKANHSYFGWSSTFKTAKEQMERQFRKFRLKQLTYSNNKDMKTVLPKKDTHAGWSYILTGKRHKGEYLEDIFNEWKREAEAAKNRGTFGKPILCGTRTQASGQFDEQGNCTGEFKSKTRLVSMIDIYVIFSEMMFARPLQDELNNVRWYSGGKDDSTINSHINVARSRNNYSLTIDYSKFDQSISNWLIHSAFDIVKAGFNDRDFDEEMFQIIQNDFVHKVFIDGEGNLLESHKGVPSGSMFTQIIDSIVNRLIILTYANAKDIHIKEMFIMGDDNLMFTDEKIDLADLSSYISHNFGIQVNTDKCHQVSTTEAPEYLSRFWDYHGVYREPNVLFSKLIYPERFRNYMRNGENLIDPRLIVYSYVLGFRLGMEELINVREFELDLKRNKPDVEIGAHYKFLPGSVRFGLEYGGVNPDYDIL